MTSSASIALISIDTINEIVHPDGKLSGSGYSQFIEEHDTLTRLGSAQEKFRSAGCLIVHVRVGFSSTYVEHPAGSPLLGGAKEYGALLLGTWATEFHEKVSPADTDLVLNKHRVSAFHGTALDLVLRARGINEVYLAGVATDLAVEAAARDAHDRDYTVKVLADCSAAASNDDHNRSCTSMANFGSVLSFAEVAL